MSTANDFVKLGQHFFKDINMGHKTVFGNTVLSYANKGGVLKPDEDGYYTVVLGALDVFNSGGERYTLTEVSRNTFSEGSKLDQRASEGLLKGEWGHPKPRDFPNPLAFERRVRQIEPDRISHSIRKVYLKEIEYNGKRVLGIIGELKPCGPYGGYLKEMLDDKHQNVCFSGRYYSNVSKINGIIQREIHTCGSWDYVTEPGVYEAKKYASPSLESFDDLELSDSIMNRILEDELTQESNSEGSMESGYMSIAEVMKDGGIQVRSKLTTKTASFNW
jgi:hypothetical protein